MCEGEFSYIKIFDAWNSIEAGGFSLVSERLGYPGFHGVKGEEVGYPRLSRRVNKTKR